MNEKQNVIYSNKRQPLNFRLMTWDMHTYTQCGGVKHVIKLPPPFNLGFWCNITCVNTTIIPFTSA